MVIGGDTVVDSFPLWLDVMVLSCAELGIELEKCQLIVQVIHSAHLAEQCMQGMSDMSGTGKKQGRKSEMRGSGNGDCINCHAIERHAARPSKSA